MLVKQITGDIMPVSHKIDN